MDMDMDTDDTASPEDRVIRQAYMRQLKLLMSKRAYPLVETLSTDDLADMLKELKQKHDKQKNEEFRQRVNRQRMYEKHLSDDNSVVVFSPDEKEQSALYSRVLKETELSLIFSETEMFLYPGRLHSCPRNVASDGIGGTIELFIHTLLVIFVEYLALLGLGPDREVELIGSIDLEDEAGSHLDGKLKELFTMNPGSKPIKIVLIGTQPPHSTVAIIDTRDHKRGSIEYFEPTMNAYNLTDMKQKSSEMVTELIRNGVITTNARYLAPHVKSWDVRLAPMFSLQGPRSTCASWALWYVMKRMAGVSIDTLNDVPLEADMLALERNKVSIIMANLTDILYNSLGMFKGMFGTDGNIEIAPNRRELIAWLCRAVVKHRQTIRYVFHVELGGIMVDRLNKRVVKPPDRFVAQSQLSSYKPTFSMPSALGSHATLDSRQHGSCAVM
jgi:hypothetical protein